VARRSEVVSLKSVVLPCPSIDSELREFLDDVLIPILVRDAVRELSSQNQLAPALLSVGKSPGSQEPK
jgi:hypothetical protein